jgi:hypothetical protein
MVSLLVFAGASQFALVGLLAQGTPPLLAAGLGLLLNLRHAFYGPALRPYLRGGPLEAFLLTDEVFALALKTLPHLPEEERRAHFLGLGLGAYLSWNLGTLLGSLGAEGLKGLSQAFGFALPALFFLLALPHLRNRVALLAGGVALVLHLLGRPPWAWSWPGPWAFFGGGHDPGCSLPGPRHLSHPLPPLAEAGEAPPGPGGAALVVALFLVSAFGPPPSWAWLKTLAALGATYLAERLLRNLGLAVLVGMVLYALF